MHELSLCYSQCRATAAVESLARETKRRAGGEGDFKAVSAARSENAKRKRLIAPEEKCPYCDHAYTVRDGFSTKTSADGERCVQSWLLTQFNKYTYPFLSW